MTTTRLSILAGSWLALACAFAAPAFAQDDTLDRGIGSEWSSMDPHVNFDAAAGSILSDAYEGLVNYNGYDILPGAAESWEVSEDGLTYTFNLREGLVWSNGDPLVAQDYVDGLMRTLLPDTGSERGYYFTSVVQVVGAADIINGDATDASGLGMTAPDDRTVVIQLENPAPHVMNILGGAFSMPPLHSPSVDAGGAGVFVDPARVVTNGAYLIREIVPQSHVLLERNPLYWDAANVSIPFVKYHVTEDASTELLRYQAGELEVTYDIPLAQMESLQATVPDEVKITAGVDIVYYSFNLLREPFQDINLRRALTIAIDRETLEGRIVRSGATPNYSFSGGFDPNYNMPVFDEAAMTQEERNALAQELYAAAGYGPDNPLTINILPTVAEESVRRAQGIALMWKQVLGVDAVVEPQERKAWLDAFYAGTWDVFADNLVGDFPGPETFLPYMRPSAEAGYNWVSPEYEAAMDVASAQTDPQARLDALAVAEKILLDDYIVAPISIIPTRQMVSPRVGGWVESPVGYHNSQYLTLE
ncbi:MAG: peptide ABC transporter substrate-binding protein [Yoonia sp.]|uniref:peptide ABC transporter substrate-binding protein n=1 Tax=Yoonia sp. TaxID=2212373 RepID=UPI00273DCC33|nr:peptide ABC transporter substrate-binding protein [Yoonia sp.]MDP5084750.1 peptide ABC transporter substrate-binding protein [Yoonia sp.]